MVTTDWTFIKGYASQEGAIRARVNEDVTEFQTFNNGRWAGVGGEADTTEWVFVHGRPGQENAVRFRLNAGTPEFQQWVNGAFIGDGAAGTDTTEVVYLKGYSAKSGGPTITFQLVDGTPTVAEFTAGAFSGVLGSLAEFPTDGLVFDYNPVDQASVTGTAPAVASVLDQTDNNWDITVSGGVEQLTQSYKGNVLLDMDGTALMDTGVEAGTDLPRLYCGAGEEWTLRASGIWDVAGSNSVMVGQAGSNGTFTAFSILLDSNGTSVRAYVRGTNQVIGTITPGEFVEVIARWDGTDLTFWVNGTEKAGTVGAANSFYLTGEHITIGGLDYDSPKNLFNGKISRTSMWDSALSDEEIAGLIAWTNQNYRNKTPDLELMFVGSSITGQAFNNYEDDISNFFGITYQKYVDVAVHYENGRTTAGLVDDLPTILASHPVRSYPQVAVIQTTGNDATASRPYSSTTQVWRDALDASLASVKSLIEANGFTTVFVELFFANYEGTTYLNEAAGKLPYSVNHVRAVNDADWKYVDGTSYLDWYTLCFNNYATWLEGDYIHPNTTGEEGLRDFTSALIGEKLFNATEPTQLTKATYT